MNKDISITVNGRVHRMTISTNLSLQALLKEKLALTGTKRACGRGECGSCIVLFDNKPVNSCMILAVEADGHEIITIEGETPAHDQCSVPDNPAGQCSENLSDLQEAFIRHGAIQCGFCTPGMIMAARGLLMQNSSPSREDIVEAISGNLCRCTGYESIIRAIEDVAAKMEKSVDSADAVDSRDAADSADAVDSPGKSRNCADREEK